MKGCKKTASQRSAGGTSNASVELWGGTKMVQTWNGNGVLEASGSAQANEGGCRSKESSCVASGETEDASVTAQRSADPQWP